MGWAKAAGARCAEYVTPELRLEISPLVSLQGENLDHYFKMKPQFEIPLHVISAAEKSRAYILENSANGGTRARSVFLFFGSPAIVAKAEAGRSEADSSNEIFICKLLTGSARPSVHISQNLAFDCKAK